MVIVTVRKRRKARKGKLGKESLERKAGELKPKGHPDQRPGDSLFTYDIIPVSRDLFSTLYLSILGVTYHRIIVSSYQITGGEFRQHKKQSLISQTQSTRLADDDLTKGTMAIQTHHPTSNDQSGFRASAHIRLGACGTFQRLFRKSNPLKSTNHLSGSRTMPGP